LREGRQRLWWGTETLTPGFGVRLWRAEGARKQNKLRMLEEDVLNWRKIEIERGGGGRRGWMRGLTAYRPANRMRDSRI